MEPVEAKIEPDDDDTRHLERAHTDCNSTLEPKVQTAHMLFLLVCRGLGPPTLLRHLTLCTGHKGSGGSIRETRELRYRGGGSHGKRKEPDLSVVAQKRDAVGDKHDRAWLGWAEVKAGRGGKHRGESRRDRPHR